MEAAELARRMRTGVVPADAEFDRYLAPELRAISGKHWTPLAVVVRGVRWLAQAGARTIVDLGSGAGKFCVAGALAAEVRFTGVERRGTLVAAARALARDLGVDGRVTFVEGDCAQGSVPAADAYYLFNPYAENIATLESRIADDIERGDWRFVHDVQGTRGFIDTLPRGALVLTYHGYGARMPHGYESLCVDRSFSGELRLWQKKRKK